MGNKMNAIALLFAYWITITLVAGFIVSRLLEGKQQTVITDQEPVMVPVVQKGNTNESSEYLAG